MYHTKENSFFHGIMFHHFHDTYIHKKSQGSIDKDQLYKIINYVGKDNILDASIFYSRFKEGKLKNRDICITFDDGLRCQYDIAIPVLEDLKIKAFFFVYSSLFVNQPDLLEIYRYFRNSYFKNVNDFYNHFFRYINKTSLEKFFADNAKIIKNNLEKFQFYTLNDVKFRLIRNIFLSDNEYKDIMKKMFAEKNFIPSNYYQDLFLSNQQLKNIHKMGHLIGLHSHSHPTFMEKMEYKKQKFEYQTNQEILSKILDVNIDELSIMSHPCGSYNMETLEILKNLNVDLGFTPIMKIEPEKGMKKINNSSLEIARQNHAMIIKNLI